MNWEELIDGFNPKNLDDLSDHQDIKFPDGVYAVPLSIPKQKAKSIAEEYTKRLTDAAECIFPSGKVPKFLLPEVNVFTEPQLESLYAGAKILRPNGGVKTIAKKSTVCIMGEASSMASDHWIWKVVSGFYKSWTIENPVKAFNADFEFGEPYIEYTPLGIERLTHNSINLMNLYSSECLSADIHPRPELNGFSKKQLSGDVRAKWIGILKALGKGEKCIRIDERTVIRRITVNVRNFKEIWYYPNWCVPLRNVSGTEITYYVLYTVGIESGHVVNKHDQWRVRVKDTANEGTLLIDASEGMILGSYLNFSEPLKNKIVEGVLIDSKQILREFYMKKPWFFGKLRAMHRLVAEANSHFAKKEPSASTFRIEITET